MQDVKMWEIIALTNIFGQGTATQGRRVPANAY